MTVKNKDQAAAVLVSGGVESAAMLSDALKRFERVYPVYIRKGFIWETVEQVHLKRLLKSLAAESEGLAPLSVLEAPMKPVYKPHWSLGVSRIPGARAPDSEVYLPGRNLLFLSLAGLFCSLRRVPVLWIGVLKGNPFKDARPAFFKGMERLIREAAGIPVKIETPYSALSKGQVIRKHPDIDWRMTFSCLNPVNHRHCGRCQKCAERKTGFRAAAVIDPTIYSKG